MLQSTIAIAVTTTITMIKQIINYCLTIITPYNYTIIHDSFVELTIMIKSSHKRQTSNAHQSDDGTLGSQLCRVEEVPDELVDGLVLGILAEMFVHQDFFLERFCLTYYVTIIVTTILINIINQCFCVKDTMIIIFVIIWLAIIISSYC